VTLAAMIVLTASCSGRDETPTLKMPLNAAGAAASSCDGALDAPQTAFNAAIEAADLACSTTDDCVSADTTVVTCVAQCSATTGVSRAGRAILETALQSIEADECMRYAACGFIPPVALCLALRPTVAACLDGRCTWVPQP
jgi:hypothetical protein